MLLPSLRRSNNLKISIHLKILFVILASTKQNLVMSTSLTQKPPVSKRLIRVTLVSFSVSLFSFILLLFPQKGVWPFEAANPALAWFTGGVLPFTSLFIFLSGLMLIIIRYNGWVSGLAMVTFPFLLVPVGLFAFLCIIMPPNKWHDDTIYRNENEYLIYQTNLDGDLELGRLIKTTSPHSSIRRIWFEKEIDDGEGWFKTDTILYNGKSWMKEAAKK